MIDAMIPIRGKKEIESLPILGIYTLFKYKIAHNVSSLTFLTWISGLYSKIITTKIVIHIFKLNAFQDKYPIKQHLTSDVFKL